MAPGGGRVSGLQGLPRPPHRAARDEAASSGAAAAATPPASAAPAIASIAGASGGRSVAAGPTASAAITTSSAAASHPCSSASPVHALGPLMLGLAMRRGFCHQPRGRDVDLAPRRGNCEHVHGARSVTRSGLVEKARESSELNLQAIIHRQCPKQPLIVLRLDEIAQTKINLGRKVPDVDPGVAAPVTHILAVDPLSGTCCTLTAHAAVDLGCRTLQIEGQRGVPAIRLRGTSRSRSGRNGVHGAKTSAHGRSPCVRQCPQLAPKVSARWCSGAGAEVAMLRQQASEVR